MGIILSNIGIVHVNRGDSGKALEHLEKSLAIQKEIGLGANNLIWVTLYIYLAYKQLAKDYDINEIHSLIKEADNIQFGLNLGLYQLLEESSYLETAYNQVQERANVFHLHVRGHSGFYWNEFVDTRAGEGKFMKSNKDSNSIFNMSKFDKTYDTM